MDCNGHKFHLAEDSLGREPHYWTGGETRESTSTCCTPRTTTSRITGLDVGFGFYPSSSVTIFQKDNNTVLIAEIGTTGLIRTVVVLMMPHGYWIDPVCLYAPNPNAPPKKRPETARQLFWMAWVRVSLTWTNLVRLSILRPNTSFT